MNKHVQRILTCLLALVLAVSLTMLLRQTLDKADGSQSYEDALQVATSARSAEPTVPSAQPEPAQSLRIPEPVTDDSNMEALEAIDLAALREVNPDVVGWIFIPETKINYPVMQGQDNDFYLEHTWRKEKNAVGSIFMEHRNDPGLSDYNTLIYGHNMKDGSMFAQIRQYAYPDFYEKRPYIYYVSDAGIFRYEVFSAYQADVTSLTYNLDFSQEGYREVFLEMAAENSVLDTSVVPELLDPIMTLSTCSGMGYSHRWVVHARLKMVQAEA